MNREPAPAARIARATLAVAIGLAGAGATVAMLPSCSTVGAPPVVPMETALASADASVKPSAPPAVAVEDRARCDLRVTLNGRIRTGASCQLDEQISHGSGKLRYPCTGDGPADLEIGSHRFTGSVVGGKVALELTTELDWDDGCHWETHQTVTGALRSSTFKWSYSEKPIRGASCFASCTATADLKAANLVVDDVDDEDDDP